MKLEESFLPPSPGEIGRRIEAVQARMAQENLDWYVCFDPDNVYYLTNFANFIHERPFIILVPAVGATRFIVPKLEIPHVLSRKVGDIDLVEYFEFPAPAGKNWYDRLRSIIAGAKRVGVESVCQLQIYDAIPAERVRSDIVDELRFIKSPYEIGRMAYAGRIASAAMADLLAKAEVGRPVSAVSSEASRLMMGMIVRDNPSINPFATKAGAVFQPPAYSDDPHNFTDLAMVMQDGGPHVSLVAPRLNGYASEIERTFFLGHVPDEAKRPYEVMMKARRLALAMTLPGARLCDVDQAVNNLLIESGYGDNLLHRTGHGMGVTGHEAPFLAEGDERIIEPGMSLTIEPGIYLPGVGGFRHSDTIIITDDGNRLLTNAPDSLEELTL